MTVDNVFIDPCDPTRGLLDPPVGPTVDDLATALGSVTGLEASAPTDITVAGSPGKRVDLTVTETVDPCPDGEKSLLRGTVDAPGPGLGDDYRLWIVDVDGHRLVMVQVARTFATTAQRTELALDRADGVEHLTSSDASIREIHSRDPTFAKAQEIVRNARPISCSRFTRRASSPPSRCYSFVEATPVRRRDQHAHRPGPVSSPIDARTVTGSWHSQDRHEGVNPVCPCWRTRMRPGRHVRLALPARGRVW